MSLIQHLDKSFQDAVLKKWQPILDQGAPIKDEHVRMTTAICLENTEREYSKYKRLNETYVGPPSQAGGFGAQGAGSNGGGALGTYAAGGFVADGLGPADARIPSIVIPTARRIYPELLAHNVVGVQAMTGPIGFAFALRAKYGANGKGGTYGITEGSEIGYNLIDSAFTGASGVLAANATETSGDLWQAFAGTAGKPNLTDPRFVNNDGEGASLANSEWWNIGEDMPMATFGLTKGSVEAVTRKLGAHWSLELAEDMMNMHGLDVDPEMVNIISYEVQAEIDRQLLAKMVLASLKGGASTTSVWSAVSADGRNQNERIGTLYTHILTKAQKVAINTRRGSANFMIASPNVCALVERMACFQLDRIPAESNTGLTGVAKIGQLKSGGMTLFRDTFANGNYILLGYKGPTPYDSGVIFCPYIPLQLNRAVGPDNMSPRIAVRTRYGILDNLYGSQFYYQFIKVDGMTNGLVLEETSRIFLQ